MSPKPLFILLRHLPTADDAAGLLTPHDATTEIEPIDEPAVRKLSQAVWKLADGIGRRLVVTCSPTDRGRATSRAIVEHFPHGVSTYEDACLSNIDQGVVAGSTQDEFSRSPLYWRWHHLPHMTSFPGGETLGGVVQRIDDFLGRHCSEAAANLVISHTTPLQVLVARLLGVSPGRIWSFYFAHYSLTAVYGDALVALNSPVVPVRWITQLRE